MRALDFFDPKVRALQKALDDRNPFCSGIYTLPNYQRFLYYTQNDLFHRIDFSNVGVDDLEALYRTCKPAEFGRGGENILDESYRKAGKMDLTAFATLLDPRSLGIHEQVSKALLTQSFATMDMELYKLNVYGEGDFFKSHKDTPRGQDMFGSLVVVLPTAHTGGQLVLRHGEKERTIDFAEKFAAATEPSICFVAFYGDIEHEVLPVTSGYRVTLTYNLYHKPIRPTMSSILTPFHVELKQALIGLVNDASKLPNGGYLGFGLVHEYVHTGHDLLKLLPDQLRGADRALADVCTELGLRYSFRLLYRRIVQHGLNLITTKELDVAESDAMDVEYDELSPDQYLRVTLDGLTIEEVECIDLVGGPDRLDPRLLEDTDDYDYGSWLRPFHRNPVTQVLEITPMRSTLDVTSRFMTYGNEAELDCFYGNACMLIAVEPAASRSPIVL